MELIEEYKVMFQDYVLLANDIDKIEVKTIMDRYKHTLQLEQWSLRESVALETRWLSLAKHCEDTAIYIMRRLKDLNQGEFSQADLVFIKQGEDAMSRLMAKSAEFKILAIQIAINDMKKLPRSKRGLWPSLL